MSNSIVRKKSFELAVKVVKVCRALTIEKKEFTLSSQLLRSGTSIGSNVREALNTQTRREFIYKLSISQRECDETLYWLELLNSAQLLTPQQFSSLQQDATEIFKIIRSIILTAKTKAINEDKGKKVGERSPTLDS